MSNEKNVDILLSTIDCKLRCNTLISCILYPRVINAPNPCVKATIITIASRVVIKLEKSFIIDFEQETILKIEKNKI